MVFSLKRLALLKNEAEKEIERMSAEIKQVRFSNRRNSKFVRLEKVLDHNRKLLSDVRADIKKYYIKEA